MPELWGKPLWDKVWPFLDPWDSVRKKKPEVVSSEVLPDPLVSAERLQACALLGLHLLAAANKEGSRGSQSSGPRRQALTGKGDVESWTGSEGTSSSVQCEHNVGSLFLSVMEQDQSGEEMSIFSWKILELGRVALRCHITLDMLCQEVHEPGSWAVATKRPDRSL